MVWKRVVAVAAMGFVIGAVGFGFTTISPNFDNSESGPSTNEATFQFGQVGVNSHGESYGPLVSYDDPPDLFEAGATNGNVGYVRWSDLWEVMRPPDSLTDALAMKPSKHVLSVFARDGTTVVGEFVVMPGIDGP